MEESPLLPAREYHKRGPRAKHTRARQARQRRRQKERERLQREQARAQHALEALARAIVAWGLPATLAVEPQWRLQAQRQL
jgi:hypothetical protein